MPPAKQSLNRLKKLWREGRPFGAKAPFTTPSPGDKPFKILGVYVVKAGEPLAKPAP